MAIKPLVSRIGLGRFCQNLSKPARTAPDPSRSKNVMSKMTCLKITTSIPGRTTPDPDPPGRTHSGRVRPKALCNMAWRPCVRPSTSTGLPGPLRIRQNRIRKCHVQKWVVKKWSGEKRTTSIPGRTTPDPDPPDLACPLDIWLKRYKNPYPARCNITCSARTCLDRLGSNSSGKIPIQKCHVQKCHVKKWVVKITTSFFPPPDSGYPGSAGRAHPGINHLKGLKTPYNGPIYGRVLATSAGSWPIPEKCVGSGMRLNF